MASKRALTVLLVVLSAMLFISHALAGGYSVSGVGFRARSLAGAFRAVADDWSAVYYNPAGLARIEQSQLNFTLGLDTYQPTYTPDVTLNGYGFGFPTDERYPDDLTVDFPSAAAVVVAPFGLPLTAAFAAYQSYDENVEWDLYRFPYGYNPNPSLLPGVDFRNDVDVLEFQAAIARSYADDKFHAGIGVSLRRLDYFTGNINLVPNELFEPLNSRPYDRFVTSNVIDGFGLGFGFNLGLLYDVSDKFSIGASYFSPTTFTISGDGYNSFYAADNQEIQAKFHDPDHPNQIETAFSGGSVTERLDIEADMTIPSEFGFGIAMKASDYWTISADLSYTMWSNVDDVEIDIVEVVNQPVSISDWPLIQNALRAGTGVKYGWDDAIRFSIGAAGQVKEYLELRGGYSYDQSAVPDEAASPLLTDTGDRHHIAGGISYFYNKLEFSFGAEVVALSERSLDDPSDINGDGVWDNLSGTYSNTAFNTTLSMTIRF